MFLNNPRRLSGSMVWLLVCGLAAWLPSIGGKHFDDDFLFVFIGNVVPTPVSLVTHRSPFSTHYRPLEALILLTAQQLWGLRTSAYVVQGLAMSCHLALAVFLFLGLVRLGFRRNGALLAAMLFVTHPSAVAAVLGNDSTSQLHSTWLGFLGTWLIADSVDLIPAREPRRPGLGAIRAGRFVLGVLAIVAALLFKETAIGFLMAGVFLVLLAGRRHAIGWTTTGHACLTLVVVLGGYLLLRRAVGLTIPSSGRTAIAVSEVPRNLAQLFAASMAPVSTVQLYLATVRHAWLALAGLAVCPLLVATAVVYGLIAPTMKASAKNIAVFVGLMMCALFPAFAISHVSELYAYSALPLVAGAIGLALQKANGKPLLARTMMFLGIVISTIQVQADWSKAALMKANGEAAERLIGQLVDVVRDLPTDTTLYMLDIQGDLPAYSVYLERGLAPVTDAGRYVRFLANRPDVAVTFVRDKQAIPRNPSGVVVAPVSPGRPIEGLFVLGPTN